MAENRVRTSARMVTGFRRLRKSKHFMEIHSLIVAGVACTEVARRVQQEWKEMMDVTQESLTKQLQRYRDGLRVGGLAPHERYKKPEGGEPQPEKEGAEPGAWAAGEVAGGQMPGVARGGAHLVTMGPISPLQKAKDEKVYKGVGVMVPGPGIEGEEPILPSLLDVREELIDLYKLQIGRVLAEMDNEAEINKLLPGTGLEVNTAAQILKAIHIVNADLGLGSGGVPLSKYGSGPGGINIALGISIGEGVEEGMPKSLIVRTISEKKSRKRILRALGAGASLVDGTNNGEMSKNGPDGEDGQVIENVREKGESDGEGAEVSVEGRETLEETDLGGEEGGDPANEAGSDPKGSPEEGK